MSATTVCHWKERSTCLLKPLSQPRRVPAVCAGCTDWHGLDQGILVRRQRPPSRVYAQRSYQNAMAEKARRAQKRKGAA